MSEFLATEKQYMQKHNKDINQVYEGLRTLWTMVSHKLYSAGAANDEAQKDLHVEIIARIDMLQEFYKVSNKTINDILRLAEQKNHFKNYFSSIFSVEDILINPDIDIKKLVTIN